jgi:hypothetical protein
LDSFGSMTRPLVVLDIFLTLLYMSGVGSGLRSSQVASQAHAILPLL